MIATMPSAEQIFAANRAAGRIALSVVADSGISRRARVHEVGGFRVRFPNGECRDTLDAVLINTSGGMAGGDRAGVEVHVGAGAQLTVTSAAAEKIYRSLGSETEIVIKLAVEAGGSLAWLPQETILFDGLRLRRSIDVAVARGAKLLLAEAMVFGRSAMGETLAAGQLVDRWRVRVDGALRFAETIRLEGNIASRLAERAVTAGAVAVATVIRIPGGDDCVAAVRVAAKRFAGEVGISAWNGFAVARLVAPDTAVLRRDLIGVLTALGAAPLPRLWLN